MRPRKRSMDVTPSITESLEATADLLRRLRASYALVHDKTIPLPQRAARAVQTFDKQTLTGLSRRLRRTLESHLVAINQLQAKYDLQSFDDYQKISEADLQRILDILCDLALDVTDPA